MPNVELSSIIYEVLSKATAFTTALRFDQLVRTLDAQTVAGALTFTRVTGLSEVRGSVVNVRLTADGVNLPNLSAFQMAVNSGDYDNRAGAVNDLTFWYNGFAYWVAVTQPVGAVVIPPPDTTAPILQSAVLDTSNFALIRLTYNEVLSSTSIPATSAFTASGNTISSIAIAGSVVSVTLGTALAAGASTTLAYTVPGSNRIQDTSSNAAIAFSQGVSRPAGGDTTAPVLQSAALNTANYAQILLTYNEALSTASVPAASAYTLTGQTVSGASISGSVVTVTLSAAFPVGGTGTLAYTVPGTNRVQDAAGNAAIAFSQSLSRPAGGDTTAPVLQSIALNSANFTQILATYDESLDSASVPATSAFTLTGQTISSVSISGSVATVTLSAFFPEGASGTFAYVVPGSNKIQDASGNAAIAFSQTLSRGLAARDFDFRGASALPSEFSTVGLTSSSFSAAGFNMLAPATDWGAGLLIGPNWNTDRVLSIYLVTPNSNTTKNYGSGISPTPQNWLNRTPPPDTIIAIRTSFFYNSTSVKAFSVVAINTRMRVDFTKVGNDIRIQVFRWNGTAFVLANNGDYTSVGAAIAAGLANAKMFVDAYENDVIVERITN